MSNANTAKVVTAVLGLMVIGFAAWKNSSPNGGLAGRVRAVTADKHTDAAREGDVEAYLECFGGEMAARLEASRNEMAVDAFGEYLKDRNREIKGIAINEPVIEPTGEAHVRVEYVYADRNEAQNLRLLQEGNRWKITAADTAERVPTAVPYGTPVY